MQATTDPATVTFAQLQAMRLACNPFVGNARRGNGAEGGYRGRRLGGGSELDSIGPWQPGDDLRHIDWHATARTGQPQVRRHFMEAQRPSLIVADLRPHLYFGLRDALLSRVVCLAAAALAWRLMRGRQRLAMLVPEDGHALAPGDADCHAASGGDHTAIRAASSSRAREQALIRLETAHARRLRTSAQHHAPPVTLATLLREPMAIWPQGGDVIIVSDFSFIGDEFAELVAHRTPGTTHAVCVEDTALQASEFVGWYPIRAGRGSPARNISVAHHSQAQREHALDRWHDMLAQQLQKVGMFSVRRCNLFDLESGRLR